VAVKKPDVQSNDKSAPPIFGVIEMEQCEVWIEGVEARCPHCHTYHTYLHVGDVGDIVDCRECSKQFQLGEQR
jgi:uncharacterized protein (DUF983 family)